MAPPGCWRGKREEKVEESDRREAFVLFWLLLEVGDRLIFNNSGMNEGGVLEAWWVLFDLPCAGTHWVNVLHRVLPY